MQHYLIFLYLLFLVSCQNCHRQSSGRFEQDSTFSDFLKIYPPGSRETAALSFLINNAPDKDIDLLNRDSLKQYIDCCFNVFNQTPWQAKYPQELINEYLLPYRIANEPLEYYWRWDCLTRLNVPIHDRQDILAVARRINAQIKINTSNLVWGNPPLNYSSMLSGTTGKCDDRVAMTTMAMRSFGIPAAFDFIPLWGNYNNGHSICSVILPDGSAKAFQNPNDDGENTVMYHKTPKIYRRMFSPQIHTILYENRHRETLPDLFSQFDIQDVTSQHRIGQCNVNIKVSPSIENPIIYLAVFSPSGWYPIAYTQNKGNKTLFSNIGTGTDLSGTPSSDGENTGIGILYLPCTYINQEVCSIANPFILSDSGTTKIICRKDSPETITLYRKYPRVRRMLRFAEQMVGGVFEGANRPDFSDARMIHQVIETPQGRIQSIEIKMDRPFKYVRYRKSQGTFSIGELKIYDRAHNLLTGKLLSCNALSGLPELQQICDGDPLSYFSIDGGLDLWAGLQLQQKTKIGSIEFCPRNDDNEIRPGDLYELYFWDNGWISLGKKKAADYQLLYEKVPAGALLWLRNLSRGKEERPFTYEAGKQIWW